MDDPVEDITEIVHRLTQGTPNQQASTIDTYFTETASFTHPLCRTSSFEGSRKLIHSIYQWYKIMSPHIDLNVNSVAFDEPNLTLYLTISQVFSIWFIPLHRSPVTLTTILHLVQKPGSPKYYIQAQEDLYQIDQLVKIFAPWGGIGTAVVLLWNFWATLCCVVCAYVGRLFTDYMQRRADERIQTDSNGDHAYRRRVKELKSGIDGESESYADVVKKD